jgi:hypothetical protein
MQQSQQQWPAAQQAQTPRQGSNAYPDAGYYRQAPASQAPQSQYGYDNSPSSSASQVPLAAASGIQGARHLQVEQQGNGYGSGGYGAGNGGGHGGGNYGGAHAKGGNGGGRSHSVLLTVLIGLACLLVGAALGLFVLSRIVDLPQSTIPMTLTESQLDEKVGTYTYNGKVYTITARQAIEDSVSLESRKNDDGTYDAPSADMIISYARNCILTAEVAARGITVSDDDLNQYLIDFAGTTDISTIAEEYSMDEDQARRILIEAAGVRKLKESVVGVTPDAPEAPAEPEDGDTEVTNSEYAAYIIGLLGDNWDSENGTWANTDNPYYEALKDAAFSSTSANYEAAELAYSVASSQYSEQLSSSSEQWRDFVNTLMENGSITIDTLQA